MSEDETREKLRHATLAGQYPQEIDPKDVRDRNGVSMAYWNSIENARRKDIDEVLAELRALRAEVAEIRAKIGEPR